MPITQEDLDQWQKEIDDQEAAKKSNSRFVPFAGVSQEEIDAMGEQSKKKSTGRVYDILMEGITIPKEKSFREKALDTIYDTMQQNKVLTDIADVSERFVTGAAQGYNEMIKQGNALAESNPLALSGTPMGEGQTNARAPEQTQEQQDALNLYQKAADTFQEETVLPVGLTVAGVLAPKLTIRAATAYMAKKGYERTGKVSGAVRAATYGPVVDWYNQDSLGKQFYNRPFSTTVSGVLGLGQLAIPAVGAYRLGRGVMRSGEPVTDPMSVVSLDKNGVPIDPIESASPAVKQMFGDELPAEAQAKGEISPVLRDVIERSKQEEVSSEALRTEVEPVDIAQEIGLKEQPLYSDYMQEIENIGLQAEQSPLFRNKLRDKLEEIRKIEEEKLNNDPLYQASSSLTFDLQMFGSKMKNVKEVAEKYIKGELTDSQKFYVDTVAEQHGFSSGNELVKKINTNKLRDEELKTRLEYAANDFKKKEIVSQVINDTQTNLAQAKKAALEASSLQGMAKGDHRVLAREKVISDAVSKFKDAEARLLVDIEKAKGQAKEQSLKDQLSELKKQHAEEVKQLKGDAKYTAKWYEAEANTKEAGLKEQQKRDNSMAKEWLKSEKTSQQLARQSEINLSTALENAKYEMLGKPIKESIVTTKYMRDARVAARESEKAYRKGMYEEAAKFKTEEMQNHAMVIESLNAKKFLDKQQKYFKSVIDKKKELFKTQENFNQVASLLDRFGLGRKDYDATSKTESLQQWSTKMNESLGTVNIPEWLYNETARNNYQNLTMWELQDLSNTLKNIQKVANQEKISIAVKKGESIDTLIKEQVEVMSHKEDTYMPSIEPGITEKLKGYGMSYFHSNLAFSTVISKLQGWKNFGALEDFWIKPVHERANLESNRINQFKTELEKIWGQYSSKERKALYGDKVYYEELGGSVTKKTLLGMALNLGNASNRSKLFGTRPVGVQGSMEWTEGNVIKLLSNNLTSKDWKLVQDIWDTVNSIWPDLSKFHAEMTGFEPQKVQATPFKIAAANGEAVSMEGGYYPLKRDPRSTLAAAKAAESKALYEESNPAWKASTEQGFTKSRTKADYAVMLDPSIMNEHIIDVVHDLHFRDLVVDYRRVLNNQEFQDTVKAKLGPEGLKAFDKYVANIANGEAYRNVGLSTQETIVNFLMNNATAAAIAYRASVITQNLANIVLYPGAVEGFGVKEASLALIKHGVLDYIPKSAVNWKAAKAVREEVYNLSPFMRDRKQTPDYSLKKLQKDVLKGNNIISDFGIALMTGTDDLTAIPMWKYAYENKLAETGNSQQAVYYADSLIRNVNGSGRKYDVAPTLRSRSVTDRIFTRFYGFMNVEFNRWVKEGGMVSHGIDNVPRFLGFVASRAVLFVIASNLLSGKGPDDKDDPIRYWAGQFASYPLQLLPMVRDVAPPAINAMLGLKTYGYRPPIAFNELENAVNAVAKTSSYIYGKGKTTGQDVAESVAKVAAYGAGYPQQFNDWFFNAYDYLMNSSDPELKDIIKRRPAKERGEESITNKLKEGTADDLQKAKDAGLISENKYKELKNYQKLSPIEKKLDGVKIEKALDIYSEATSAEKSKIRSKLKEKVKNAMKDRTPKEQEELKKKAAILQ